ncbi:MAG: hypothetical protein K2Z81_25115 [Cyanobacteria bacterium]|nr:hypothetical protein [Cyanobacteriota bacterium]
MKFISMFLRSATGAGLAAFALLTILALSEPKTWVEIVHLTTTSIVTGIGFGFGYSIWYLDREPSFRGSVLVGCAYCVFSHLGVMMRTGMMFELNVFLIGLVLVPLIGLLIGGSAFVAIKLWRGSVLNK